MEPNRDVGFTGIIASILDKKILFASESRVTNQSVFDCVESLEMREGGQDSPNERSEKQSFNDKLQKQAVKQSLEYTNTLDQNGKNLSQFLFSIRNSSYDGDRAKYDYIKSAFERIFEESGISIDIIVEYVDPTLHTVYYRQTGQTPKYPKIMVTESLTNKRFPIDSVGAGIKETLYLLACAFGTSDAVLVLDEPSTNLHPTMMKNVMNLLEEDQGNQIVVITHSPELTIHELFDKKSFPLYVSKNNGYSEVKHMDTKTSKWFTKNIPVLKYTIDPRIFFSRKVVLTEGESDRYLIGISQLIELKYPQLNLSSKDILVLGVGGKTNFKKYIKLLRVFGIKYMILADKDALKDVFKNQSYSEISSERISGDGPLFIIQEGNLENLMQKMDNESYIQAQAEHGPSKPALGYSFIEKAYIKNEQTFEPIVKLLEKITKD